MKWTCLLDMTTTNWTLVRCLLGMKRGLLGLKRALLGLKRALLGLKRALLGLMRLLDHGVLVETREKRLSSRFWLAPAFKTIASSIYRQ